MPSLTLFQFSRQNHKAALKYLSDIENRYLPIVPGEMKYISIHLYRKMINHAMEEGLAEEDLDWLPTPLADLDKIQAVPADHFFELHEVLDARLGPAFSVRVGQAMKIEDYGVLGLSWRTCSYVGEIFERSERYFKLLSDTYVFKVEKQAALTKVFLYRDAHRRGLELSNQATFSATVVVLRAMTDSEISPVQVAFKHGPPSSMDGFQEAFQCELLFNQPENVISYRTEDFHMRTAKADESINRFLLERVAEETKGIEVSANGVYFDVKQLIKESLPSGIPGIVQVADHLGMSNRTLTRRLAENGYSFRDLIRQSQEEEAKNMLKNPEYSVADIAFQTGFSEQSAFNRAFKRWTGMAPLEFRKQH